MAALFGAVAVVTVLALLPIAAAAAAILPRRVIPMAVAIVATPLAARALYLVIPIVAIACWFLAERLTIAARVAATMIVIALAASPFAVATHQTTHAAPLAGAPHLIPIST